MMTAQSASPSYVNVLPTGNGSVLVDHQNAPVGKPAHSYVNIPFKDPAETATLNGRSESDEGSAATGLISNGLGDLTPPNPPPSASIAIPTTTAGDSLKRHSSLNEGRYNIVSPGRITSCSAEQAVADAKLKLLMPGQSGSCENCNELSRLLAMWEIGVSGLTRNYSRILAHLIKIRNSSMALEFRLKHATEPVQQPKSIATPIATPQASLAPPSRYQKNRQSMFVNIGSSGVASIRDHDIAENMYPERRATTGTSETGTQQAPPTSAPYAGDMKDLNSHLEEAIDLCQQLAAACFKTNHLSDSPSASRSQSSIRHDPALVRKHSTGASPNGNVYKPALQSISEKRLTSGKKKRKRQRTLERVPSAPNLELSGEMTSSCGSSDLESSFVKISKEEVPDLVTNSSPSVSNGRQQSRDAVRGVAVEGEGPGVLAEVKGSQDLTDDGQGVSADVCGSFSSGIGVSVVSDHDAESAVYRPESVISSISTYSDTDVKCVMSKIASLEEERYKLLETINALQEDNSVVCFVSVIAWGGADL